MDYIPYNPMKPKHRVLLVLSLVLSGCFVITARAQENPSQDSTTTSKAQSNRIRIEVVGGDSDVPVENASVYLKYVEERKLRKDKKIQLNVKTNREGVAHIPDAPMGKVLVQVIAEGWKTYGKWIEITEPRQIIKIKLEKPPRWY